MKFIYKILKEIKSNLKEKIYFSILALVGFTVIFITTHPYDLGFTSDSVEYITAARSFLNGQGLLMLNGEPMVWWPPIYPIIVSIISYVFSIDAVYSARFLNAVVFGLIVYLSGELIKRIIQPNLALTVLFTIALLFSNQIIQMALMALSELLFIAFVLLYLICLDSYSKTNQSKYIIYLSIIVVLSALTRYIGIILIPAGIISIWLVNENTYKQKISHLITFSVLSILPVIIWLIRNYILSNSFFGFRFPAEYSLTENLKNLVNILLNWYLPNASKNYSGLTIIVLLVCSIYFILTVIGLVKKNRNVFNKYFPILIFIFFYTSSLLYLVMNVGIDKISNRLLAPIYIPFTLLIYFVITTLSNIEINKWARGKFLTYLLIILFIVQNVFTSFESLKHHYENGEGFFHRSWRESSLIKYSLNHNIFSSGLSIYSNFPNAIYLLTNHKCLKTASPDFERKNIQEFKGIWPEAKKSFVLWFNAVQPYLFSLSELKQITDMKLIAELEDGAVYFILKPE